jgi:hypothetical protein
MENIAEAVTVFFLGAIILAPVAALSARFAMKPMIALFSRRMAGEQVTAQVAEQGRRIELLESELAAMHESMKTFLAAAEFERQLSGPDR